MDLDEIDPGKRRKSSCFAEGSLNKFSIPTTIHKININIIILSCASSVHSSQKEDPGIR